MGRPTFMRQTPTRASANDAANIGQWCRLLLGALCLGIAGPSWSPAADFFADQLWPAVGASVCLKCHHAEGDAADSQFLLHDPARDRSPHKLVSTSHNRRQFELVSKRTATKSASKDKSPPRWLVLQKVQGRLDHGGGLVLEPTSTRFSLLERFVRKTNNLAEPDKSDRPTYLPGPYWQDVSMLDDAQLLRRVTLSLAGRLPTDAERAEVTRDGMQGVQAIVDQVMNEDAFYDRLAEAFNDILLTRGYDGVPENALSYEHFNKTRHWTQKYDLSDAGDEDAQRKARYKLTDDYREAMLREPTALIQHIVRNGRPFTEIVTADYIMVSPYTSRGYGVYEKLKTKFKNPDDPFEFVPVKLAALKNRDGRNHQESATGFYPHAGLLSTFQYLMRYPTTETNRNRLRSRMYFQHFLGIDVMQIAPRGNNAAEITAKFETPTMEASDCVVCHKVIDPVAGLFQDYYVVDGKGVYGRRKDGWFEDMFPAGFNRDQLPDGERWRALQWLGERTAADPRFAVAMVEHVYYILTGRRTLSPPSDADDPLYLAKLRGFRMQREVVEAIADRFIAANFNLKAAFQGWIASKHYRAHGLVEPTGDPHRLAELDDIGIVRMLTPEQLERKLRAIFGSNWGRLDRQFKILYGGIDSKAVTDRIRNPSGAMGAIQRMLANHMSCEHVGRDFSLPPSQRRLFPEIEPDVLPEAGPDAEAKIRHAIRSLHRTILGRDDPPDSNEVNTTYELFRGILEDAKQQQGFDKRESYFCRDVDDQRIEDAHYSIRAWRAVVTYLLRRHEFLYE